MNLNYNQALQVMGLQLNFTEDELKKAYRKLAKKHHPDVSKDGGRNFKIVKEAYEFLKEGKGQPIPVVSRAGKPKVYHGDSLFTYIVK